MTILPTHIDRGDAQDLMALQRQALGLAATHTRFPLAATCLAICSRTLNSQLPLAQVLAEDFAWCSPWAAELKALFRAYAAAKAAQQVLDYDDLLLAWLQLLGDDTLAAHVGARFDAVLVDEPGWAVEFARLTRLGMRLLPVPPLPPAMQRPRRLPPKPVPLLRPRRNPLLPPRNKRFPTALAPRFRRCARRMFFESCPYRLLSAWAIQAATTRALVTIWDGLSSKPSRGSGG